LENEGGAGTIRTHWEKRIATEEFMTGSMGVTDPGYSVLTLALFNFGTEFNLKV
jgi:leishmanolysin